MMKNLLLLLLLILCTTFNSFATIINVPDDHNSIQAAVDVAQLGDTVLVAPGTYTENIKIINKNITLASLYLIDADLAHVNQTIIDGSQYTQSDSASTIMLYNSFGLLSEIAGFTIQGGRGTRLNDFGAKEGGGIHSNEAPLYVHHNIFRNNVVTPLSSSGLSGGGGVSITRGDGTFTHNVFINNKARYAGGMVTNWGEITVRNNIFANNVSTGAESGAGLMVYGEANDLNIIENNTIISNGAISNGNGGGFVAWTAQANLINNIIWNNYASVANPEHRTRNSGVIHDSYNLSSSMMPGEGSIEGSPIFLQLSNLLLNTSSLGIDQGNLLPDYNDPEDLNNPGMALSPARGTTRNDIGAYGGPEAAELPAFEIGILYADNQLIEFSPENMNETVIVNITSKSAVPLVISEADIEYLSGDGITVSGDFPISLGYDDATEISISWNPETFSSVEASLSLNHDNAIALPKIISISGTTENSVHTVKTQLPHKTELLPNYPNPFNPSTTVPFNIEEDGFVRLSVYNNLGQVVSTLAESEFQAGSYSVQFNGNNLASGLYFVRLQAGSQTFTNKMMLFK